MERLLQWSEYKAVAEAVVGEVFAALTQQPATGGPGKEAAATHFVYRANELERQRWLREQRPEAAVNAARGGIAKLDAEVLRALGAADHRGTADGGANGLQPLIDAATQLSDAFARLTLCRQILLPA